MPTALQHKLLQIELPPPPGNWEAIVARLEGEYDAHDTIAANHIETIQLTPPVDAWNNILSGLETETAVPVPAKVIPFQWKRWAIAALVTGIASMAIFYFNQENPGTTNTGTVAIATDPVPPVKNEAPATTETPIENKSSIPVPVKTALYTQVKKHPIRSSMAVQKHIALADITETASISAPLLRDANGNVIMDLSLLTTASNNYISVTGPNGEQTRISSKFANYLMYMNESSGDKEEYLDYLIRNSNFWKTRFDQWRNKILQQGNFIPSSANFFDILELRELIKDNQ